MNYQFFTEDYEQLAPIELAQRLSDISNSLRKMPTNSFIRIFYTNAGLFLDTNWDGVEISGFNLISNNSSGWNAVIGGELLRNDIVPHDGMFLCNNNYVRLIRIESLAQATSFNEIYTLCDYFINLRKVSPLKAKRDLDLSRRQSVTSLNGGLRNIEQENTFAENEALLEAVINGDEDIFEYEIWLIISEKSRDLVTEKSVEVTNKLEMRGHSFVIETHGIENAIKSMYFKNEPTFALSNFGYKSMMPNLLPLHNDMLDIEGIPFYSRSGTELRFNLFDPQEHNYNLVIAGPPGSGKSFTCCHISKNEALNDSKVIILDRGGSYKKLAEQLCGVVFPEKFNPIVSKNPIFLREVICSMIPESEITKVEKGKLTSAIKKLQLDDVKTLSKLIESLDDEFPSLKYYFSDIYDSFSIDPIKESNFIYIDMQIYPPSILPLLLVVIIELVESLKGRKILVLDECHYLLNRNPEFIETKFREARKHMMSVIALTQDFNDFLDSKIGATIAKCSNTLMLFNHQLGTSEFLCEFDVQRISSARTVKRKYSEMYIKRGSGKRKIVRYYPSSDDYKIFTSDYSDNTEFIKFKQTPIGELFSNEDIIDIWRHVP